MTMCQLARKRRLSVSSAAMFCLRVRLWKVCVILLQQFFLVAMAQLAGKRSTLFTLPVIVLDRALAGRFILNTCLLHT